MTPHNPSRAFIYCRVANKHPGIAVEDAVRDQEVRAKEHASLRGYDVVDTYRDHASGMTGDRPGLNAMLAKLEELRGESRIVIVDDVSRITRDVVAHWDFRQALNSLGARLEIVEAADTGLEARA